MAAWDSLNQIIIRFSAQPYPNNPNWEWIDCGCCMGIKWGGDFPQECERCGGSGFIVHHKKSGTLAWYPGGPFCGKI